MKHLEGHGYSEDTVQQIVLAPHSAPAKKTTTHENAPKPGRKNGSDRQNPGGGTGDKENDGNPEGDPNPNGDIAGVVAAKADYQRRT